MNDSTGTSLELKKHHLQMREPSLNRRPSPRQHSTYICRFYIAARSRGICGALWCRPTGISARRRVCSLRECAPVLHVTSQLAAEKAGEAATSPEESKECPSWIGPDNSTTRQRPSRGRTHGLSETADTARASTATTKVLPDAGALSAALIQDDRMTQALFKPKKTLFRSPNDGAVAWEAWGSGCKDLEGRGADDVVKIIVVARCRPLLTREIRHGVRSAVACKNNEVIVSGKELPFGGSRSFGFDRVFGEIARQRYHNDTNTSRMEGRTCSSEDLWSSRLRRFLKSLLLMFHCRQAQTRARSDCTPRLFPL